MKKPLRQTSEARCFIERKVIQCGMAKTQWLIEDDEKLVNFEVIESYKPSPTLSCLTSVRGEISRDCINFVSSASSLCKLLGQTNLRSAYIQLGWQVNTANQKYTFKLKHFKYFRCKQTLPKEEEGSLSPNMIKR